MLIELFVSGRSRQSIAPPPLPTSLLLGLVLAGMSCKVSTRAVFVRGGGGCSGLVPSIIHTL